MMHDWYTDKKAYQLMCQTKNKEKADKTEKKEKKEKKEGETKEEKKVPYYYNIFPLYLL